MVVKSVKSIVRNGHWNNLWSLGASGSNGSKNLELECPSQRALDFGRKWDKIFEVIETEDLVFAFGLLDMRSMS